MVLLILGMVLPLVGMVLPVTAMGVVVGEEVMEHLFMFTSKDRDNNRQVVEEVLVHWQPCSL